MREQYKDFIRGCAFRETLLCHTEVEIAPDLLVERVLKLYASCDALPKEDEPRPERQYDHLPPPGRIRIGNVASFDLRSIEVLSGPTGPLQFRSKRFWRPRKLQ